MKVKNIKNECMFKGNHESLMNARGVYYGLVEAQNLNLGKKTEKKDDVMEEDDENPSMIITFLEN